MAVVVWLLGAVVLVVGLRKMLSPVGPVAVVEADDPAPALLLRLGLVPLPVYRRSVR